MKITISPYDPDWITHFEHFQTEIAHLLKDFHPQIEHIGSTSVPGLAAKPIIDMAIGIADTGVFEALIPQMCSHPLYVYYEVYNDVMPERRLFVRLRDDVDTDDFLRVYRRREEIPHEKMHLSRVANVHIWQRGAPEWTRHIAFREYLRAHDDIRDEYAALKQELGRQDWSRMMEYNDGKDGFIKVEEKKAVEWYQNL